MRQNLGQHFLNDQSVIEQAISSIRQDPTQLVVEIGPGKGILTEALVKSGQKVLAIEWDPELFKQLHATILSDRLTLINADIRTFDLIKQIKQMGFKKYIIVANLPYYLSSFFLRSVFQYSILPAQMILLLQAEVAERLVAVPGQKQRSVLSIMTQVFCTPTIIKNVPAASFTPPPKVNSALVEFDRISSPFVSAAESKQFFRAVKAGFGEKRKTIVNSLAGGLNLAKDEVEKSLNKIKIDHNLRAEDLTMEQWKKLAPVISRTAREIPLVQENTGSLPDVTSGSR